MRPLLVRYARAVAALHAFEVESGVAQFLHQCCELPCMTGMNAVVPRRRGDQRPGIIDICPELLVGRVAPNELPLFRIVRVAIFRHPACACEQEVIASHVEQRHLDDDCVEEIGALGHGRSYQKAAVTSAHDPEVLGRGDAPLDKVLTYGNEVVEDALAILLETRAVPLRPELPAATDIRQNIHATSLKPGCAAYRAVTRSHRDFEAPVSVEKRRIGSVNSGVFRANHEVRDASAIPGGHVVLFHHDALRIEHGGHTPHLAHRAVFLGHVERSGLGKAAVREEVSVGEGRCG
jgi:hypothetical protein